MDRPTRIVLNLGSHYLDSEIWGTGIDIEAASDAVVMRFHSLVRRHRSKAVWFPETGEVQAPIGDPATADDLEAWAEQALNEICEESMEVDSRFALADTAGDEEPR